MLYPIIQYIWSFLKKFYAAISMRMLTQPQTKSDRAALIKSIFGTKIYGDDDIDHMESIHFSNTDRTITNVELVKYCHVQMNDGCLLETIGSIDPDNESNIYQMISMMTSLTHLEIVNELIHDIKDDPQMYALMQPLDLSKNLNIERIKCWHLGNMSMIYLPGNIIIDFTNCYSKINIPVDVTIIRSNTNIDIQADDNQLLYFNECQLLNLEQDNKDVYVIKRIDISDYCEGKLDFDGIDKSDTIPIHGSITITGIMTADAPYIYLIFHASSQ